MQSIETIGKRIIETRRDHNLTQQELAEIAQIQKSTVSRWESGEIKTLRIDKVKRIADALGYNPMWILGYETGKYPQSPATKKKIDGIYDRLTTMTDEQIDKLELFISNFF